MNVRHPGVVVLLLGIMLAVAACGEYTGRSVETAVNDTTITTKIKTKLAAEQIATLARVDVDTVQGTVYLTGTVEKPELKTRATEIAQQVDGVKAVVNNLQLASGAG